MAGIEVGISSERRYSNECVAARCQKDVIRQKLSREHRLLVVPHDLKRLEFH